MTMQLRSLKIKAEKLKELREVSKRLFLKAHPEYKKFKISDRFMVEECIGYYNKPIIKGFVR